MTCPVCSGKGSWSRSAIRNFHAAVLGVPEEEAPFQDSPCWRCNGTCEIPDDDDRDVGQAWADWNMDQMTRALEGSE